MENVKQNTMKYKILFIFSFLLLTLLLFNTNVFASFDILYEDTTYTFEDLEESYTYNDVTYNVSDYEHRIILYRDGEFRIILYNTASKLEYTTYSGGNYKFEIDDYNKSLVLISSSNVFNVSTVSSHVGANGVVIVSSDVDLYDTSGNLVFQAPVPEEATLAQVLVKTQEEIPELTLVEIAKIVTLILAVVVSLVGFRKAWKLLRTSLNQS